MSFIQRHSRSLQYILSLVMYLQISIIMGLSLIPSLVFLDYVVKHIPDQLNYFVGIWIVGTALAMSYFFYSFVAILVIAGWRLLFFLKVPEGKFPLYSMKGLQWSTFNALILILRFTGMDFLRNTPFIVIFHKLMGAKIGNNVQINTKVISDNTLIEIGDYTIIGGDVTLIAHSIEQNNLITKRVKIGKNVTIGLMSVILPGVEIGDHCIIAANTVIPKNTIIPSRTIWGGVPAKQIGELKDKEDKPDVPLFIRH